MACLHCWLLARLRGFDWHPRLQEADWEGCCVLSPVSLRDRDNAASCWLVEMLRDLVKEQLRGWDMVPIQIHCADQTVILVKVTGHAGLVPLSSLDLVHVTLDPTLMVH